MAPHSNQHSNEGACESVFFLDPEDAASREGPLDEVPNCSLTIWAAIMSTRQMTLSPRLVPCKSSGQDLADWHYNDRVKEQADAHWNSPNHAS